MSKTLIISGGSDDLIEVGGCVTDEFVTYHVGGPDPDNVLDLLVGDQRVARVHAFYDGCWYFAFVGTVDENDGDRITMPPGWTVEVRAEGAREADIAPYSMSLHITLPDDCDIHVEQR